MDNAIEFQAIVVFDKSMLQKSIRYEIVMCLSFVNQEQVQPESQRIVQWLIYYTIKHLPAMICTIIIIQTKLKIKGSIQIDYIRRNIMIVFLQKARDG